MSAARAANGAASIKTATSVAIAVPPPALFDPAEARA
jgi:hypothetical protein